MSIVTRFAPSPTGYLHLGHAFSALFAWRRAREAGGRFLLRLEDIDPGRCRPEFAAAILEDLAWLGLDWDGEVRVQSRAPAGVWRGAGCAGGRGLLYPCFCTRADIQREMRHRPPRRMGPTARRCIPAPAARCRPRGASRALPPASLMPCGSTWRARWRHRRMR